MENLEKEQLGIRGYCDRHTIAAIVFVKNDFICIHAGQKTRLETIVSFYLLSSQKKRLQIITSKATDSRKSFRL